MISRIFVRWRWLRRKFNRTHWSARLLGLPVSTDASHRSGLILIQIDGLSRTQMERAVAKGRLPFLSRLLHKRHFSLETFYSGIPSTTPAVQAEIFFGIRTAVPSFQFLRRSSGKIFRMYEAESAAIIERELRQRSDHALLREGHAYSNIFHGGARFTRYCSSDFAPRKMLRRLHLAKLLLLSIPYGFRILRMLGLAVIEFGLAVADMIRGFYQRQNFLKELLFVPARVAVSILLREAIRFRVLLDIEAGVRVVHANFLGYDEQSHRRGPDSLFAHWTLKGIDRTIRDIYRAAIGAESHDYEMIVYSDHGQERTGPFDQRHGRGLDAALREVFSTGTLAGAEVWLRVLPELLGATLDRCKSLIGRSSEAGNGNPDPATQIVVTAMGPVGQIYLPEKLELPEMEHYARELVAAAGIPMVLFRGEGDSVLACNRNGLWNLPADGAELLGRDHPFLEEAGEDLAALCRHPDAGDFVISGWNPAGRPPSFPLENGAHGGPGKEETRGFLMLPQRLRNWHLLHLEKTSERVRGEDLHRIVRHHLEPGTPSSQPRPSAPGRPLRVLTYNIHSCVGLDGRIRPDRIGKLIHALDADVIAVQEVDAHRPRSGGIDQAHAIAGHLEMHHLFLTLLEEEKERYGIAVFSRHPIELIRADHLTRADPKRRREARGAIWLRVRPDGGTPFHFINTHFGLGRKERRDQAEVLLGKDWLGAVPETEPVVLCGDFNSRSRSAVCQRFLDRFRDVQRQLPGHTPLPTFSSLRPLLRIDHIFVSPHFEVRDIQVPDHPAAVMASDHLPLCADLLLKPATR